MELDAFNRAVELRKYDKRGNHTKRSGVYQVIIDSLTSNTPQKIENTHGKDPKVFAFALRNSAQKLGINVEWVIDSEGSLWVANLGEHVRRVRAPRSR